MTIQNPECGIGERNDIYSSYYFKGIYTPDFTNENTEVQNEDGHSVHGAMQTKSVYVGEPIAKRKRTISVKIFVSCH